MFKNYTIYPMSNVKSIKEESFMEKEKILSFRTEKELYEKIEYLEKNMSMSKSQICNLLIKQGLNYFSCQDEILEIISKIEKSEEKRILYLFLTLSQIKNRIKLRDINFLAGTNISAEDFIKICENILLKEHFEDIEIIDSKKLKDKDLEKCLLSENYSWEQDIEIRVKWKKN